MKRWNGWGDETIKYPLPATGKQFLAERVGVAAPPKDVTLEDVLRLIPATRLSQAHSLISTEPAERLSHARGQSLADWLALRSGRGLVFPDGVAYPKTDEQVRALIAYAVQTGVQLIPYGGGTSVAGHINPRQASVPVLTVDLSRLNELRHFDPLSLLATFGAGVAGPDLEAQLRARNCTLGHFPQSFEYSTLGGWVATRSSGQQSLRYGRIEKLFAGGRMETSQGTLDLPVFPASAAGPDLREAVLGSEGRLGIITEATVRVSPVPEREEFHAVFFPSFEHGQQAVRQILQSGLPVTMLRLSTARETATTLALAGHTQLIGLLEKMLTLRAVGEEKSMLLVGFSGPSGLVSAVRGAVLDITGKAGGVHAGTPFGQQWHKKRFLTPYLRNTLWGVGYAVDTLETATDWANVPVLLGAIEQALQETAAADGERIHVFTHLSHTYPYGSSIYTTYVFRLSSDPDETLRRWQRMKAAASQAIVAQHGTISHQHGVGEDHAPYLAAEKGPLGMGALNELCAYFDPHGVMNPGKLLV